MVSYAIGTIINIYIWLVIIRVLISWLPIDSRNEFVKQLYNITDPYLDLFKRIIPPFGMVDISPILAIMVLEAAKRVIMVYLPY